MTTDLWLEHYYCDHCDWQLNSRLYRVAAGASSLAEPVEVIEEAPTVCDLCGDADHVRPGNRALVNRGARA